VAALPLNKSERRLLLALLRHKVRFMVVGLSAAALQGAPVVTQDIDLWFEDLADPRLREALRAAGVTYVQPIGFQAPALAGGGAELFDIVLRMDGLGSFASELAHCIEVVVGPYRAKVLGIERILLSKRAANRQKDRLVIPVLEDALAVLRTQSPIVTRPDRAVRRARMGRRTLRRAPR
jgi:hypothetical protein